MPDTTIKIDNARYVITMDPERRIIAAGSVVITGSRISHVGKAADLANLAADTVIDGSGMALTPRLHQRPYAHKLRPRRPGPLPRRPGRILPAQRVPPPGRHDAGRRIRHLPPGHHRTPEVRNHLPSSTPAQLPISTCAWKPTVNPAAASSLAATSRTAPTR